MTRYYPLWALLFAFVLSGAASALEIKYVQHDSERLLKPGTDKVSIDFDITETADVELRIYDARELLIRNIVSDGMLSKGRHNLAWDGRDNAGQVVPAGAYHYTLTARSAKNESVEYDLTDLTGGEELTAKRIAWDGDRKYISYALNKPGRVNIRIGLQGQGPLLRTLLEWEPRLAGEHQEPWDGMDNSGVLDLSTHPKREILIQAFTLSKNTILVGNGKEPEALINDIKWPKTIREKKKTKKRRMHTHSQQPHETRGDFKIKLSLPSGTSMSGKGLPIVTGKIQVKLDIAETDRLRAIGRRFEAGFYVDGVFVYENEVGFLPMTWYWDTTNMNEGIHYVTANVRGYEGNFGTQTLKVMVKPAGNADKGKKK